jgi:CBS domain-containing protein
MTTVNQLTTTKGRVVHTVSESETVFEAISKMVAMDIGSVVVLRDGSPCGILTERDYLRRIALEERSPRSVTVREVMSPHLVYVRPDTDLVTCMALMTQRHIRHLPVLEEETMVGLISIGDIAQQMARERESTIGELTHYIQGR